MTTRERLQDYRERMAALLDSRPTNAEEAELLAASVNLLEVEGRLIDRIVQAEQYDVMLLTAERDRAMVEATMQTEQL